MARFKGLISRRLSFSRASGGGMLTIPQARATWKSSCRGVGYVLITTTINRWGVKYIPQLEAPFHRRNRPVWRS
jgi:hypothetical protein